jgi:hypothetical protein
MGWERLLGPRSHRHAVAACCVVRGGSCGAEPPVMRLESARALRVRMLSAYHIPMQTTLAGRGPKCRVCTHPERTQIESLLARGAGISAIEPLNFAQFSCLTRRVHLDGSSGFDKRLAEEADSAALGKSQKTNGSSA